MFKFYEYGDMPNEENYYKSIRLWGKIYFLIVTSLHNYFWYWLIFVYFSPTARLVFFIGYFMLGAFMLEWAWYNTQRIHNVDEERDSCFPAFRRPEAKNWNKAAFYPMAVTTVPARIWIAIMVCPGTATFSNIVLFGYKQRPILGWRKPLLDVHYQAMQYILFVIHFMRVSHIVDKDFDYTEWLGPGYKEK